jgi:hypothetical protein
VHEIERCSGGTRVLLNCVELHLKLPGSVYLNVQLLADEDELVIDECEHG